MKCTATIRDAGQRVDVWLQRELPDLSRTRIQSLIAAGNITVPGKSIKPNTLVADGMAVSVRIPSPVPSALEPEDIPLTILYEDGDLIVLNKQSNLVVHPAAGHPSGTLVNALLFHCHDLAGISGERRPGIVHRLDKDTTGALVVAKNDRALEALVAQFKGGEVLKDYRAIVHGVPAPAHGTIDSLIGRSPRDRKKMSARPRSGRRAVTHYQVAESYGAFSLVAVRIETGRTHQIRVHLTHIGHPVVGDKQYASGRRQRSDRIHAQRQMLHARSLSFVHPATGKRVTFEAPLPNDMTHLLEQLRRG